MKMEMRELQGDDLFTLFAIVGKLDIKDEFVGFFMGDDDVKPVNLADYKKKKPTKKELEELEVERENEANKLGMRIMAGLTQKVLSNANLIKDDLNNLLGDLTDKNVKEIEELNLITYTTLIINFFKKEELKDFFTSIALLFASETEKETENLD